MARSKDNSAAILIQLALAALLFAVALLIPFRRGPWYATLLAVASVVGFLWAAVWYVADHPQVPQDLIHLLWVSGGVYAGAILLLIASKVSGPRGSTYSETFLDGPEEILYRAPASLIGESRRRVYFGLGRRFGRMFGGVGMSTPTHSMTGVDEGEIIVSDQAVRFAGVKRTKAIPMEQVFQIEADGDRLLVQPRRGTSLLVTTSQPLEAARVIRAVKRGATDEVG